MYNTRNQNFSTNQPLKYGNYHVEPSEYALGNLGATPAIDLSLAAAFFGTLNANATFTLSNAVAGGSYLLRLVQDATGSRTMTFSGITWLNSTGAAPSAGAASKILLVSLYALSANTFLGTYAGNY